MKSKIANLIFTAAAIILAAVFIGLTVRQTDLAVLKDAAGRANYFWFFIAMVLGVLAYWFRAARWKLLLSPMGYDITSSSSFWAISMGYFLNLTIPRSGEIVRATSLYKMEKVPVDKSIGTIVLERVIDLFFLLSLVALAFLFNAKTLISFLSFGEKPSLDKLLIPGIGMVVLFIAFLLVRKKIIHHPLYQKAEDFVKGIWEGFKSILHLKERTKFVLYSVGIWACYFLITYLALFAFPETSGLSLSEGLFLIVAGAFGTMMPAVGGLAYPYIMSLAFGAVYMVNGEPMEEGKTIGNYFGLLLYFATILYMLILGFLSIYFIAGSKKK